MPRRSKAGGTTADAWVKEWTTSPGYQRASRQTNEHNAERVSKFGKDFEGVILSAITREQATQWADENVGRVDAVRSMLNDAVRAQKLTANPFAGLRRSAIRRQSVLRLELSDIYAMQAEAKSMYPDWPVMHGLVTCAAFSGMLIGELCALRWDDINWEEGTISVRAQWNFKTKEEKPPRGGPRVIALAHEVADALREIPHEGEDNLVFYGRRDKRRYQTVSHTYYWSQFREAWWNALPARRQHEIPRDMDWTALRDFLGFHMAGNGATAEDIGLQLGRRDVENIKKTYLAPQPDVQRVRKLIATR